MIKALKKRFIFTSMIAITLLLLILIGGINIVNVITVRNRSIADLNMISAFESKSPEGGLAKPAQFMQNGSYVFERNEYDVFMASNFFSLRIDEKGFNVMTDISRTSRVDAGEAFDMAIEMIESGEKTGMVDYFRYRVTDLENGGKLVVFLDTMPDIRACLTILIVSLAIGLVCWIFMLIVIIILSGRAVKPIAENYEKQKQFVTNAGHEIKTPLAIIRSNTDAMELIRGKDKYSKNIKDQTERLADLMNKLLTLAKMDEGTLKQIAAAGNGAYVHAGTEEFGLAPIIDDIKKMEEEKYNSIIFEDFDEQYMYFFGAALLFLVLEMLVGERRHKRRLFE